MRRGNYFQSTSASRGNLPEPFDSLPFEKSIRPQMDEYQYQRKLVFQIGDMIDDKTKRKAMRAACTLAGVFSVEAHLMEQTLTVVGLIDPLPAAFKLKKIAKAELISINPSTRNLDVFSYNKVSLEQAVEPLKPFEMSKLLEMDQDLQRKLVFRIVDMIDDKTKQKAMKAACDIHGVVSVEANLLTLIVVGQIDPLYAALQLKKNVKAELMSDLPVIEENREGKKQETSVIVEEDESQGTSPSVQYSYALDPVMPPGTPLEFAISNGMVNLQGVGNYLERRIVNMIPKMLENTGIGKVGIYGNSGVGKTTLMEALKDLPAVRDMFDCVICLTIHKDLNSLDIELERKIAEHVSLLGVDDYDLADLVAFHGLKFLLILDNVNEYIGLNIPDPTPSNGCKIVLMSRSAHVCDTMQVDLRICLEDLLSWELFLDNVGCIVQDVELHSIARQIVKMCSHLERAIILMAKALKDVDDIDVWNTALAMLSVKPAGQLEDLLVSVIRYSWDRLDDNVNRKCLRNFVLYRDNQMAVRETLIQDWVTEGMVNGPREANNILENLIHADLLGTIEDTIFMRMIDHYVFFNSIIPHEDIQLFLIHGALGLTEPPQVEEWEKFKVIDLMQNELSVLPDNPICPILSSLFLQRNYKLRKIPPLFFSHMPILRVLNLSRTRIKSLPGSLFSLVNLERFFLNCCELLMTLPPEIGELKNLEVLDLEGTEIMNLPKNVGELTNLTHLDLSFYKYIDRTGKHSKELIPSGVISSLYYLEELNINVDQEDKRWEACVEVVIDEICRLPELNVLKFYFPSIEHLGKFLWSSQFMLSWSFLNFRFVVGPHANRILSRLPCDVEFELQRHDNYLFYVNGIGIPGDIKKVLHRTMSFFLDRHATIEKLSEFGIDNMDDIRCCVVGECNELQVIVDGTDVEEQGVLNSLEYMYIYYMRSLESFWEGPVQKQCFSKLKSLTFKTCPKLTTILTPMLLVNLVNLEELTLDDCSALETIVMSDPFVGSSSTVYLPQLKRISLRYLPELISISTELRLAPNLDFISIYDCPRLVNIECLVASSLKLRKITGERSWWEALQWSCLPSPAELFVPIDLYHDT